MPTPSKPFQIELGVGKSRHGTTQPTIKINGSHIAAEALLYRIAANACDLIQERNFIKEAPLQHHGVNFAFGAGWMTAELADGSAIESRVVMDLLEDAVHLTIKGTPAVFKPFAAKTVEALTIELETGEVCYGTYYKQQVPLMLIIATKEAQAYFVRKYIDHLLAKDAENHGEETATIVILDDQSGTRTFKSYVRHGWHKIEEQSVLSLCGNVLPPLLTHKPSIAL